MTHSRFRGPPHVPVRARRRTADPLGGVEDERPPQRATQQQDEREHTRGERVP
ncbi:hypothetical protein GCM10010388_24220 [Streptomyces mauvecolor]